MGNDREEIIRRAIIDKLGSDINFYTADDILTVAEISESQLEEIASKILLPSKQMVAPTKARKPRKKRKEGTGCKV